MGFSLYNLFKVCVRKRKKATYIWFRTSSSQAGLLVTNGISILHPKRFLAKCKLSHHLHIDLFYLWIERKLIIFVRQSRWTRSHRYFRKCKYSKKSSCWITSSCRLFERFAIPTIILEKINELISSNIALLFSPFDCSQRSRDLDWACGWRLSSPCGSDITIHIWITKTSAFFLLLKRWGLTIHTQFDQQFCHLMN